jgi:hypothetical protein
LVLTEWKRYKRYSDNRRVKARLIERDGKKLIEINEPRMETFSCPFCGEMLTQADTGSFPNFFLEPPIFHQKHKPVD